MNEYVTASELAEFVYCKRAWWLRRHGLLDKNEHMREGVMAHNKIFNFVSRIQTTKNVIKLLLAIIGVILVFLIFYLIFFYP